ncbi:protein MKS1-like [Nicotiana tabacum]|uniref:Protein MKS1-like n=1 Tax=Nicotiana tabacum TaxID=4097 RepID=A0A1S3ZGI3_TOBAC|nr:PREDICTED: protein MKS1-like [Nicotiana tabacum]
MLFSSFSPSPPFSPPSFLLRPINTDSNLMFPMDDQPEYPAGKSPRRELQGPRPTPLKVRKDSHKIRKPPVVPHQQHHQPAQAPPRPPVIIYTVSPKVIHANPSEFMTLVQRLTGPDHSSTCSTSATATTSTSASASASYSYFPFQENMNTGAISPAARFASIENTRTPQGKRPLISDMANVVHEGIEIGSEIERSGLFPGILSPNPSSLPPIPPNFFSPPSQDPNPLGFFYDLSPVLHSNKNYFEPSFLSSPTNNNFMISPRIFLSPGTPSLDLFNNLFDV